jgi:glutamate synthase (NADPH/NADH) large chain
VVEGVGDHALEYMTGGLAVILGKTGRNIAAGMSGGVAYIYKLRADQVNHSALVDQEVDLLPLDASDKDLLRDLLESHVKETGSALARTMLDDFESAASDFTKILPRNYAEVKAIQAKASSEGVSLDSPEVWSKILEVSTRG